MASEMQERAHAELIRRCPNLDHRAVLKPRASEILVAVEVTAVHAAVVLRGVRAYTGTRVIALAPLAEGAGWQVVAEHDNVTRAERPKAARNEFWMPAERADYMAGAHREGTTLWPFRGSVV